MWPVLLVICRALYFVYSLWCLLFPVVAIGFAYTLASTHTLLDLDTEVWMQGLLGVFVAFASLTLTLIYLRRSADDPNPFQSAFMSWFGTLRAFRNTLPGDKVQLGLPSGFLVENPQAHRIGGKDIQQVLDRIQPGDILLRGFDGYLDGAMIRRASVCSTNGFQPGWFTHAALYMGELDATDRSQVPQPFQHHADYFQEGSRMLVHAMAKGVHCQDLLTFCRSDYLAVLRIQPGTPTGLAQADVAAAVQSARQNALQSIGGSYNFDVGDASKFHRFSCSMLVYHCLGSIQKALRLEPVLHALYPLSPLNTTLAILRRTTVTPDDFYALVQTGTLACVWEDPVSTAFHADQCVQAVP
jgi:hypothetical protein